MLAGGGSATFSNPHGVVFDAGNNIIVADYSNHQIRKVTPNGTVTTVAGNGRAISAEGQGSCAHFRYPRGMLWMATHGAGTHSIEGKKW